MNMDLYNFNNINKYEFHKQQKYIEKQANYNRFSRIDPKRNLSWKEKNIVWNKAKTHYNFDYNIFRLDIIGNLGIKGICYNNNCSYNKYFAIEYEHYVSHSNNGRTDINNVCILNAGINRSKGKKEIYKHNYEEFYGLKYLYGVSPENLLKDLQYSLHETCLKYNLYFIKYTHYWTLERRENGKYADYNNQYDYTCSQITTGLEYSEIHSKESNITPSLKILIGACIVSVIHETVTYSYKEYIKPIFTDNKDNTLIDKVITYSITGILGGIACYIGVGHNKNDESKGESTS